MHAYDEENNVSSWTVFFMLKPLTTIHTTLLTEKDDVEDDILISFAKSKIQTELGIDIDLASQKLGINDNFGTGWITVEHNDVVATEQELSVLPIIKTT